METVTPILNAQDAGATRAFYEAAGFAISYWQERPYLYGAVERGDIRVHFVKGKNPGIVLVNVPRVAPYHEAFANGLRTLYGQVPLAGSPRISRLWSWHTRFRLFDPTGNEFIFVNEDEPEIDYDAWDETLSPLRQALVNVEFLRDVYTDDKAAAKLLDKKLVEFADAAPADRARALGIRAELALAMGDADKLAVVRDELASIPMSDADRAEHSEYIEAADRLARWMTTPTEAQAE